ncbi:rod shape-determining protein MreD [Acinetobacter gerneri]|jgi:rod shape-determining protein MreD|uniref:Rod shape-determining protein MreD n=2 Tax=Acinetobacter gerneri TaxID=202952 RepID=N8ZN05_9GAMM|nr:rod shape-determining protein MreD [Acinetobacter gerneri]ENV35109.1 rod shape-determining protein MreD [Acinetobacter gerneri DSM 14967 = CIP 107464 = MTCC 9824]EPR83046.1 Rod shape-determining protein MreD [Acinetobacter gerneri DSM 14967 = CIP 107464 = MTCC 9824]MCH4244627.1 rod shape-determining protein MreD [Acinetobacter gerneri]MDQ9009730.1 rod shape-determining protein MreD [Acinetobacter gerneri]MDQ9013702.1 rod shape-determining protein MreD [Acinetobacter gerneri]
MLIAKKLPSEQQRKDPLFVIIVSVIIASILMVYPLSYNISGWRPLFMVMVLIFWVLCQPTWCGVWFAFTVGLLTDLLFDLPLGMNALSYVIITFVARYFTRERRLLTFSNLWIIASFAILAHILFTFLVQIMSGIHFSLTRHWQPLLTSILFWPVLYYMLKRWRI